jgi:AcrR family transcriptional regulator
MPKTILPAHQERSRQTLARLLKAAIEVLDKEGLDGATIPRIAKHAGVTPGAIYRRFPDKDALLREVCLRMLESNARHTEERLRPEKWEGKSLADIAEFVIQTTLKGYALHRGLLRAFALFAFQHSDLAFAREAEALQWQVMRTVTDLLLTRRGEIRHPDPEFAVPFALMMVGQMARGVFILPRDPKQASRLLPDVSERMQDELPKMFLRYLDVRP